MDMLRNGLALELVEVIGVIVVVLGDEVVVVQVGTMEEMPTPVAPSD